MLVCVCVCVSEHASAPVCVCVLPHHERSRIWSGLENASITVEEALEVLEALKEV